MSMGLASKDLLKPKFVILIREPNPITFCEIAFLKPVVMASDRIITARPSEMLMIEIRTMGREKLFLSFDKIPRAMKSSKFKV